MEPKARIRTIAFAIVGAVALYGIVAGVVAPLVLRGVIADRMGEKLGRAVALDSLSFNPYTLDATAKGLRILEPDGRTVFASFDRLDVDGSIESLYRLAPVADEVTLGGLRVNLVRDGDTHYNVSDILGRLAAAQAAPKAARAGERPQRFSFANIRLVRARVDFDDRPRGARHTVSDIDVAIPFISNLPGHLKEYVQPTFSAKVNGTPLRVRGETKPFENSLATHLAIDLDAFDIHRYVGYSPVPLPVKVDSGLLDARIRVRFTQLPGKDPSVDVAGKVALRDVRLSKPEGERLAQFKRVDADIASFDPIERLLKVASIEARDGSIELVRRKDGTLDLPLPPAAAAGSAPAASPPWRVSVDRVDIAGYQLAMRDEAVTPAATQRASVESLELRNLSTAKDAKATLAARLALGKAGTAQLDATLAFAPLAIEGHADLRRIDLVPLRPYVEYFRTVALKSGEASAKGEFAVASEDGKPRVSYSGAAAVDRVATTETTSHEDLVNWGAVRATGLRVRWAKEVPLDLAIADVAVDKAYARVVVTPEGKINLTQLKFATPEEPQVTAPAGASKPRNVRIDHIRFTASRLDFTDHFIKPNYSADVGELHGSVTNLSSDPASRGAVDLRGSYDKSSPITIAGTVNPLAGDLFLDIAAKGADIELPKLSAYSRRYAGYGITSGKLTLDVKYHVEHGKLQGRNNIHLDQLVFGDKVESPEATKLPVLFAVNLLKDSKGAINVELPISGSLDDPQFDIGGLIAQVVGNLLKKAATSPFSLLAAAMGGTGEGASGEDLAHVDFDAGGAELGAAGRKKLDDVAKALADRPGLTLEMAARVDAEKDTQALKLAALRRKLEEAKRAAMAAGGKGPEADPAKLTPEERTRLLAQVSIGPEDLAALAQQRSEQVKNYLVENGHLPAERVRIASAEAGGAKEPSTRVDFSLR